MPKLDEHEIANRSLLLSEAYIPYLREHHPMGSVVAINCATGEYVVGRHSPEALDLYAGKFGDEADLYLYLEPIHWPDTRPWKERLAQTKGWKPRYLKLPEFHKPKKKRVNRTAKRRRARRAG